MKAIVQDRYGSIDALALRDVDPPRVGEDEVLVRARAASVHADVWHVVSGLPYVLRLMGSGLRKPRNPIPGTDVAGVVEAVGAKVTRFRPGDAVFGETMRGMQWQNGGAFAELVAAPEDGLEPKPEHVTFEQAAAVPTSGIIALQCLRHEGGLREGHRVLVNGAGGGVGSLAVAIARAFGARVTAVDSGDKLDLLRSLGAERVIDYRKQDFTRESERYDLVLDVPGNHPFSECRRVLAPTGKYVLVGHDHYGAIGRKVLGSLPRMLKLVFLSLFVKQLPRPAMPPPKRESMGVLRELLESRKLVPVVDRTYPLSDAVEALRYLRGGQVRGKVVLTM